jgi:hypothetical protein
MALRVGVASAASGSPPSVTTEPASEVRPTGATLAGSVNANGSAVSECRFEYGTTTRFGRSVACAQSVGDSSEAIHVSAVLSGLNESTVYYVKLSASNANGAGEGATESLETTRAAAPTVSTGRAIAAESTATFTGSVVANGSPLTNCMFEYGTTTAYGRSVQCAQTSGEAPGPVQVTSPSGPLLAGTVYHYRLTAVNGVGVGHGSDSAFRTAVSAANSPAMPPWQPFLEWGYGIYDRGAPSGTASANGAYPPRASAAMARCLTLQEPSRTACVASVREWRRIDAGLSVYHCAAEGLAGLTGPAITPGPGGAGARSAGAGARSASAPRAKAAHHTSEAGWPPDECLKMDKGPAGGAHTIVGIPRLHNWLLGGYGSDTIIGGKTGDVIWADYQECCWPRQQTAIIHAGNGRNVIYANDTRDYVWTGTNPKTVVHAHVSGISGVIHCQSARIVVFLSTVSEHHFKLDGCHRISHFSVGY